MFDKRKATRSYAKENLKVLLYEELPPIGRKNKMKKKGETSHTWRPKDSVHNNSQCHPMVNREISFLSS